MQRQKRRKKRHNPYTVQDLLIELREFTFDSYGLEILRLGLITSFRVPLDRMLLFHQTKDVNPYLIKHEIKLSSVLDLYDYFKDRDGFFRLYICFFSAFLNTIIKSSTGRLKRRLSSKVFKALGGRGKLRYPSQSQKVTLRDTLNYFIAMTASDLSVSLLYYPFESALHRLLADYEPLPQFDHLVDCLCKIVERDGFLGLYRGFQFEVLKKLVVNFRDTIFYWWKFNPNTSDGTLFSSSVSLVGKVVWYALEALRNRSLVAPGAELKSVFDVFNGFWFFGAYRVLGVVNILFRKLY